LEREELSQQLWETYNCVIYATCPEDVFGVLLGSDDELRLSSLQQSYNSLARILDPNIFGDNLDDKALAAEGKEALKSLFESAKGKVLSGRYGQKVKAAGGFFSIKVGEREYHIEVSSLSEGDIAFIHPGYCSTGDDAAGQVVAKIVADRQDNPFLDNEAACLDIFKSKPGAQNRHLPVLLDRFKTSDGRLGLIIRRCEGYTLERLRQMPRYRQGIPEKHVVWMMNRGLSALGFAHLRGVVHCNLAPEHLVVRPRDHNMWILDWTGAAHLRTQPYRFTREGFSGPEVGKECLPIPSSDIYSFGKCMIYALGGDVLSGDMPSSVNPGLRDFLRSFILESPIQRPGDAWALHRRLSRLRKEWWGPDKFLELKV
jgi:serine/threonine protein kinase